MIYRHLMGKIRAKYSEFLKEVIKICVEDGFILNDKQESPKKLFDEANSIIFDIAADSRRDMFNVADTVKEYKTAFKEYLRKIASWYVSTAKVIDGAMYDKKIIENGLFAEFLRTQWVNGNFSKKSPYYEICVGFDPRGYDEDSSERFKHFFVFDSKDKELNNSLSKQLKHETNGVTTTFFIDNEVQFNIFINQLKDSIL